MARPAVGTSLPQYELPCTVFDAALNRIRWLFEEFAGQVSVSCSGGKDSTVIVELAARAAREGGYGPLRVKFLDQEAEYESTIVYMRTLAARDDVDLDWYQVPFRLFNATNHADEWSDVWDPAVDPSEWIRPKEPTSIHVNDFRDGRGRVIDRFKPLLHAMNRREGGAVLTGMRCEESPARWTTMTNHPVYKWTTWSGKPKKRKSAPGEPDKGENPYYTFSPIYDWTYRDVWAAIEREGWAYNRWYDVLFRYGVPARDMRVSSFHHEESQRNLYHLQEVEPETWERATRRYAGLATHAKVGEDFQDAERRPLPFMFASWEEYFEHLLTKMIADPRTRERFRAQLRGARRDLGGVVPDDRLVAEMVAVVIANDSYGAIIGNWVNAQQRPDNRARWAKLERERTRYAVGE